MITTLHDDSLTKQIAIIWHIEDIQSIRSDLTDEQAYIVLQHLKENHDASLGINWEVIEIVADILYPFTPIDYIQQQLSE